MINNSAAKYGVDIASVPKRLIKINKTESNNNKVSRILQDFSNIKEELPSGGRANLYYALVDKYNTIVSTDNLSKIFLV